MIGQLQELGGIDFQRLGQPAQGANAGITGAPLQIADISALHIRRMGKLLLRHAAQQPVMPHIFAEEFDQIHAGTWPQVGENVCPPVVSFSVASQGADRDRGDTISGRGMVCGSASCWWVQERLSWLSPEGLVPINFIVTGSRQIMARDRANRGRVVHGAWSEPPTR